MNKYRVVTAGFIMLVVGAFSTSLSNALTEDELNIFSQNNVLFYDPSCIDSSSTNVSVCNTNLPEATITAIENDGVKEKAESNIERYKYAEEQTGIPWQAVAALHYREGLMGSNTSISNGQVLASSGCYSNWDEILICSDPNEDAKEAAEHLIEMAKWVYGIELTADSTVEEWGQAFLAYNRGIIYKSAGVDWKESPYPMNGFDEAHALYMQRPAIEATVGLSGRDANVGALAIFAYLCGGDSSSGTSSSSSASSSALNKDITLIGDSVSVAAGDKLKAAFPGSFFTMVVSRHPTAKGVCDGDEGGLAILRKIVAGAGTIITQNPSDVCETITIDSNSLKDNIVWELGANPVGADANTMREVIAEVGNKNLFLVTPYDGGNLDTTNAISDIYRNLADEYDNVYIVDWNAEMLKGGAATYLVSDQVHPNDAGQKLLVDLITEAIGNTQACEMTSYKDAKYQERLGNLHTFHQGSGTWAYRHDGCSGSGAYVYNNGCGLMSIYAAYYMFSGDGVDDEQAFLGINNAAMADNYYVCSYYGDLENGSHFDNFGKNLEDFTGMKAEYFWSGYYSDSQWDDFVTELKKGHKLLIGTTGSSCGGSSLFAGCMHALLLDQTSDGF